LIAKLFLWRIVLYSKKIQQRDMNEVGTCLNCGAQLEKGAKYCSFCGQKRIVLKDYRFSRLIRDSLYDFLHIDAKLVRSIFPLLFKPGYLTVQWIAGKHARYFKPFKMFLVISILYFILASVNQNYFFEWGNPATDPQQINIGFSFGDTPDSLSGTISQINIPEEELNYLDKKMEKFDQMGPKNITEYLMHNISKMVVVLIPVVAFLLWLIYIRKRKLYYEHLIFTLHVHAFIFLFASISELILLITGYLVEYWIVLPIILIYVYLALKPYYQQGYGMTLWSNFLLWLGYLGIIIPVFFVIAILVSIMLA
jgi:ribosomal protein L40E